MRLIIIGGVAAGMAAAARARRLNEKAEIIVFEKGEYVSFSNCGLPYYAGDVIKDKKKLLIQTPESLKRRYNLDVRTRCEVTAIDKDNKSVQVKTLDSGKTYDEKFDYLLIAQGAKPIIPSIPGAALGYVHVVRTIGDIERIKAELDSGKIKKAVIVGAGFVGIEMAENFCARGVNTTVIEKLDQVLPFMDREMANIAAAELARNGVQLELGSGIADISEKNGACVVSTDNGLEFDADMVIMSIGVTPDVELAVKAGIKIGARGIITDSTMRTSEEYIYAAGDVCETMDELTRSPKSVALAGPAAKQAIVAANNIMGIHDEYSGATGTSIVKAFTIAAGATGYSEKQLIKSGVKYRKVYIHSTDHAGYYPGASKLSIKLLYEDRTGVVLGAQVAGGSGVDKRIDVMALAVKKKLTVSDLATVDLCYAPQFGSTNDPVNLAGMAALNDLRGLSPFLYWDVLTGGEFLLDVRTRTEFALGSVPGAINVPVDELRTKFSEIPKDKKVAVFCQAGMRGHVATRILKQHGLNAENVSGGYSTYSDLNWKAERTK